VSVVHSENYSDYVSSEWMGNKTSGLYKCIAQEEMKGTVYIEPPKLFGPKSGKDLVLLLLKSLYGLKQAPRTFYKNFRDGLLERGFTESEIDPCLFLKKGCMCVVYVDDTIFAGPDAKKIGTRNQITWSCLR
jgi:hypothetical protein